MKNLVLIIILLFPFSAYANTFIEKKVNGYKIKVIEYDIKSKIYDIHFYKTNENTQEPLDQILTENNAITGVNGVFFCPEYYSFCAGKEGTTNNERIIAGVDYEGYEPSWDKAMFAIDKNKNSFIFQRDNINTEKESEIYYGLSNRPLILKDGENQLEGYYEQGLIDSKMTSAGTKNFICNNQDKSKIYFGLAYSIDIDTLAVVLKDFGCSDALNLDAGLSTSFIYNGKYLVGPQRNIIDAVGIERIGFDVKKNIEISKKISEILIKRSEEKSKNNKEKQIKYLESYISQLDDFKGKIYDKYSTDIIEKNSLVGEIEKVGYKIEINDLKPFRIVYLLNKINYDLKFAKKDIESRIEEEKKKLEEEILITQ